MPLPLRCVLLLAGLAPLYAAGPARAELVDQPTTDTVSVVQSADGPQVLITGSPLTDRISFPELHPQPEGEIRFQAPSTTMFAVDVSAQGRCLYHPTPGPRLPVDDDRNYVVCSAAGLSPSVQLRVALGAGDDSVGFHTSQQLTSSVDLGDGDDSAYVPYGTGSIHGGPGQDSLRGARVFGDDGDDLIAAILSNGSELHGGDGDDVIWSWGHTLGDGGPGDDLLIMASGAPNGTAPAGSYDDAAPPASCGPGDDTVERYDDAVDPLAAGAECETDIQSPQASRVTVRGTLAVGSTLRAVRAVRGAAPSREWNSWVSCDPPDSPGADCELRSTCPTFTLAPHDLGHSVWLTHQEDFSGSDGRYRFRIGNDLLGPSTARVGAPSGPGSIPGGVVAMGLPENQNDFGIEAILPYPAFLPRFSGDGASVSSPPYELRTDCSAPPVTTAPPRPTPPPTPAPLPSPAGTQEPGVIGTPIPLPATPASASTPGAALPTASAVPPIAAPVTSSTSPAVFPAAAREIAIVNGRTIAAEVEAHVPALLRGKLQLALRADRGSVRAQVQVRSARGWSTVARGASTAPATAITLRAAPAARSRLVRALRARATFRLLVTQRVGSERASSTRRLMLRR